ncbi:DMT family transporter [Devosia sp.]|uniref:DMT family transporter n=1 Tax=Devosia sp. TaxID=1871048 RepID=UPI002AFEB32D|nr:DMT family transporter [Devosia sp.]
MTRGNSGFVLCVSGIALMCGMDAVAKALGASFSPFQIVFMRYLGAALWLALWIFSSKGAWPRIDDIGRQALRAVMLVATASLFFFAVTHLPLAAVAALGMTAPVYMTLLGALFLKENMRGGAWLALALGIAGSAVIVLGGGALETSSPLGGAPLAWTAAALAPVAYAVTMALLKHHSGQEEPAAMSLGQSLIAALLVLPLAFGPLPEINASLAGQSALIGFLGALGFLLLLHGLKRMPVSAFAVLDYSGLVWAAFFGFIFFQEVPGLQFWLGALLIVSACALNARRPAPELVVEH